MSIINSPENYDNTGGVVKEVVRKLGPHIKCSHLKGVKMQSQVTVHIDEVRVGTGNFDVATFLREVASLENVPNPELERLIRQGKKSFLSAREPRASLTAEEAQLVRSICERMTDEASGQWPVFEWDVINETRDNHIIRDLVGKDAMVDWFKIARRNTEDRDALLYLNENKVISDPAPGDVTENMKRFENEVQYLLDNGAPLSALGFQSRFAKQISPETLYKRLEYFEHFNLPIAATEFEMKNTLGNEKAKAVMTERAMTVLFSHRLVNGIYAWTIRAGGRNADRAIVNSARPPVSLIALAGGKASSSKPPAFSAPSTMAGVGGSSPLSLSTTKPRATRFVATIRTLCS